MRANERDAANPGLVRPPAVYLAAIAIGVGLHLLLPLPWLPPGVPALVGAPLVLVANVLFVAATGRFRAAGTSVSGKEPSSLIVRSGPYRFSRNPIYLAFTLLVLGIACWVNSVWLLATLACAVALMSLVVIPREERYLERRFGAEYLEYKARVRRWL